MTRILIADDHPVVLAGLSDMLRSSGFDVVAATRNGADAIALARRLRPDLLIIDLRMPGLDGLGVLRELSSDEPRPRSILLTAEVEGSDEARARALGVDAVILKESALERLVDCVRDLVDGRAGSSVPESLRRIEARAVAREAIVLLASGSSTSQLSARMGLSTADTREVIAEIAEALRVSPDESQVREACVALIGEEDYDDSKAQWLQERYGLTRREISVAALLAQGMTNREIATRLGITLNTVKTHISSIHSKMDVPSTRRLLAVLNETREPG